jgi:hypothetical protein
MMPQRSRATVSKKLPDMRYYEVASEECLHVVLITIRH